MQNYDIAELKRAWIALYFTDCNAMWFDINFRLAELLAKQEYKRFVEQTEEMLYCGRIGA